MSSMFTFKNGSNGTRIKITCTKALHVSLANKHNPLRWSQRAHVSRLLGLYDSPSDPSKHIS
jgi:hypothetical protein